MAARNQTLSEVVFGSLSFIHNLVRKSSDARKKAYEDALDRIWLRLEALERKLDTVCATLPSDINPDGVAALELTPGPTELRETLAG